MLNNLSKEYIGKLEFIKNHFGIDSQFKKLVEELEEAEDEIADYAAEHIYYDAVRNPDINIDKLLGEITDCYVVAFQVDKTDFVESLLGYMVEGFMDDGYKLIREINFIYLPKILEIAKQKIDRTLERIESGYYESNKCPECNGKGSIRLPYARTYNVCTKCNGTGETKL